MKPPGPQADREFLEAASCCSKNGAHPCAPPLRGLPGLLAATHGDEDQEQRADCWWIFCFGSNPKRKQRLLPLPLLLPSVLKPREARHANWVNPKGGAQGCAPFPEAQDAPYGNSRFACEPNGFIVGRGVGRFSFGYFSLPFKEK
jgi:hypothetical protein